MKKTLCALAATAMMGCYPHSDYHFNDELDGEKVRFYEANKRNILVVEKDDGYTHTYRHVGR